MAIENLESLQIERVRLDILIPDSENARLHDERNLASIRGSLERFGQVEPLVVRLGTNQVVGGNGRLEAMIGLGWKECDVVYLELTDMEATALAITLNRTAELAEWDFQTLAAAIRELQESDEVNLLDLGWQDHELQPLLEADWTPPNASDGNPPPHVDAFIVTQEQRDVIMKAIEYLRAQEEDPRITEGRALELISIEFLNAPPGTTGI